MTGVKRPVGKREPKTLRAADGSAPSDNAAGDGWIGTRRDSSP